MTGPRHAGTTELGELLAAEIAGAVVRTAFGQATVEVPLPQWTQAALTARDALGCSMFDWLGAEDAGRPGATGQCYVITLHIVRPEWCRGLLMRTEVAAGEALPSVAEIWPGAAWHEREAAEMFGLALAGHPGPRRLLLPDSFSGHPLRKDFVLASRVARPWPGRLEPGEARDPLAGSSHEQDSAAPSKRRLAPPGVPGPEWGPRREDER